MAEPCFHLSSESPDGEIALTRRGLPPMLVFRVGIALFLACFAIVFLGGVAFSFSGKLPIGWLGRFDVLWRVALAYLFFAVPLLVIYGLFIRAVASRLAYWRRLEWNRATGRFEAQKAGWLGFGRELVSIPLANIERLSCSLPPEGPRQLRSQWNLEYRDQNTENKTLETIVTVQDVDKRAEAIDLLFRVAHISGFSWYREGDSNVRIQEITLLKDRGKSRQTRPVPQAQRTADYNENVVATALAEPQTKVPKLKLEKLKSDVELTKIVDWNRASKSISVERDSRRGFTSLSHA